VNRARAVGEVGPVAVGGVVVVARSRRWGRWGPRATSADARRGLRRRGGPSRRAGGMRPGSGRVPGARRWPQLRSCFGRLASARRAPYLARHQDGRSLAALRSVASTSGKAQAAQQFGGVARWLAQTRGSGRRGSPNDREVGACALPWMEASALRPPYARFRLGGGAGRRSAHDCIRSRDPTERTSPMATWRPSGSGAARFNRAFAFVLAVVLDVSNDLRPGHRE
jgi:hypothetical protein